MPNLESALVSAINNNNPDKLKLYLDIAAERGIPGEKISSKVLVFAVSNNNLEMARLLVEYGVDVNKPYGNSFATSLHYAALEGHDEMVQFLISNGATVDSQNGISETPLQFAASRGHLKTVQTLLKAGAKIDSFGGRYVDETFYVGTPLYQAVKNKHFEVAHFLLQQGADLSQGNLLSVAVRNDDIRTVNALLQYDKEKKLDVTAAFRFATSQEVVDALMRAGVQVDYVDSKDRMGKPLLHCCNSVPAIKALINAGADVDAVDRHNGRTALMNFCESGGKDYVSALLDAGANVDARDKRKNTALHFVGQLGRHEIASMLLKKGADVHAQNEDGDTPLHTLVNGYNKIGYEDPVFVHQVETFKAFIQAGADINAQNKYGNTPLHNALGGSHPEFQDSQEALVRAILSTKGLNVNAQNDYGETPLHVAVSNGFMVQELLAAGANVNAQNADGQTPLDYAKNEEVASVLRKNGAKTGAELNFAKQAPRKKDVNGDLRVAVMKGDPQAVLNAIQNGADVRVVDKNGNTLLHEAVRRGKMDVAKVLIECGADMFAKNKEGKTAANLADFETKVKLLEFQAQKKLNDDMLEPIHKGDLKRVQRFVKYGANVHAQTAIGKTPLLSAIPTGKKELVEYLIKQGANVNTKNFRGLSPIHVATFCGQQEIAQILLKNGADVNAQDVDGNTALHIAVARGNVQLAKFLIENGASVDAKDKNGKSPLDLVSPKDKEKFKGILASQKTGEQQSKPTGAPKREPQKQNGAVSALMGSAKPVVENNGAPTPSNARSNAGNG